MTQFVYGGAPLTEAGLQAACDVVGVKAAEIWSVIFTETDPPYGGFWEDANPQILYERHVFSRLSKRKYDKSHPDISSKTPGDYGPTGSHQYNRLRAAAALDETAALRSASWGIGQTLGENHKQASFATVQDFVTAMFRSEDAQLLAAANEMTSTGCAKALAIRDWKTFARIYNGKNYEKNHYDQHLASWYAKLTTGSLPDLRLRAAQFYLIYGGYHPGPTDGLWGQRVIAALQSYRAKSGLKESDHIDDATFDKLAADFGVWIKAKGPFDV
jgi:hypothetical protein